MPLTLRDIPKVDRLLAAPDFAPLLERHSRTGVVEGLRQVLDQVRAEVGAGAKPDLAPVALAGRVERLLAERDLPSYRRVINATGVILHTGLGRAVLPQEAVAALVATASSAQRLEIDLATGERGGRDEGCAALLRELTGCEAPAPPCSSSPLPPAAGRSSCRAARWWRSAARSVPPT